jgi:hypothetical protein
MPFPQPPCFAVFCDRGRARTPNIEFSEGLEMTKCQNDILVVIALNLKKVLFGDLECCFTGLFQKT